MTQNKKFETLQIHAGYEFDPVTKANTVPIYQSTSYTFESSQYAADLFSLKQSGNIYTRLQNPTNELFEKRVAALEGGTAAVATSTGHAAQYIALTTILKAGDKFAASPFLYGGTINQFSKTLPSHGITCNFSKSLDIDDFRAVVDKDTKAIYVETIGNPGFRVPDFEKISNLAKEFDIPFVVDNTFGAGGYFFKPLEHGADIVVESATKWIGGHGTTMGGVIVDGGSYDWSNGKFDGFLGDPNDSHATNYCELFGNTAFALKCRLEGLRELGAVNSPMNSFMLIQGIETLSLRAERESENALKLATWLEQHPKIETVNYPGLESFPDHTIAKKQFLNGYGAVLSIILKDGKEAATKVVEGLKIAQHVANVGDVRTLVIQPAATTHSQLSEEKQIAAGVFPALIRISCGIEHIDDIIEDFNQALEQI